MICASRTFSGHVRSRRNAVRLPLTAAISLALSLQISTAAFAQQTSCASPASEGGSGGGRAAATRLRHSDPLVRDMARADVFYDQGRRDEAEAIYSRLAKAPADKRQTARRAQLKLAGAAISRRDYQSASALIAKADQRGALPELRKRARVLLAQIEYRRGIDASEAALDAVDPLVTAGRFDEAVSVTDGLLVRQCPIPTDYYARVNIRRAQIYRAKGDFASANAAASAAQAQAFAPRVRDRATGVIGEIAAAADTARLYGVVAQGKALIDGGDAAGAVALLEPLLASQPAPPAELEASIRLRLARAYGRLQQYDKATAVLQPLLSPTTDLALREKASRAAAGIDAAEYAAVARTILVRGQELHTARDYAGAAATYQQILAWNPPAPPEITDSARLGLARALARQGNRSAALEQVALVQTANTSPRLAERASDLLADIQNDIPLNRLTGFVELGTAYDSNAPTLISAVRDQDEDVPFPPNQRFDDGQIYAAARLQYRIGLGDSGNYWDVAASGLRSMQFDLSPLDQTLLGFRTGPVFTLPGGRTQLQIGGRFDAEWLDDQFRSSEPGAYVGIRQQLAESLSASATYTIAWHNDYRNERDGTYHTLDTRLRYAVNDTDVVTFRARAQREGAELADVRNWGFLGGATWQHRWTLSPSVAPFIEVGADAERLRFDRSALGDRRRDWRVRARARVGAELDQRWQVALGYSYLDISSNQPARDRLANHRLDLSLRYSWN